MCAKNSEQPTNFINFKQKKPKSPITIWTLAPLIFLFFMISGLFYIQHYQKAKIKKLSSKLQNIKPKNQSKTMQVNKILQKLELLQEKNQEYRQSLKSIAKLLRKIKKTLPKDTRINQLYLDNKKKFRLKCHSTNWKTATEFLIVLKKTTLINCPKLRKASNNKDKNIIYFTINAIIN